MCLKAEKKGVYLGEFQLERTLGSCLNCTGSMLVDSIQWTLVSGQQRMAEIDLKLKAVRECLLDKSSISMRTAEVTVCINPKDCETALDSYCIFGNVGCKNDVHSVIAHGNECSAHGGPS